MKILQEQQRQGLKLLYRTMQLQTHLPPLKLIQFAGPNGLPTAILAFRSHSMWKSYVRVGTGQEGSGRVDVDMMDMFAECVNGYARM